MKMTMRKPFTRLEAWAVFWLRIWWSIILYRDVLRDKLQYFILSIEFALITFFWETLSK